MYTPEVETPFLSWVLPKETKIIHNPISSLLCRKRCLTILVEVCWKMPGKATTALSLPMDRQEVESHIRWLAMGQTKVKKSMCSIKKK